jgi:hypothetical protein
MKFFNRCRRRYWRWQINRQLRRLQAFEPSTDAQRAVLSLFVGKLEAVQSTLNLTEALDAL